jgi:hypothetical protein
MRQTKSMDLLLLMNWIYEHLNINQIRAVVIGYTVLDLSGLDPVGTSEESRNSNSLRFQIRAIHFDESRTIPFRSDLSAWMSDR